MTEQTHQQAIRHETIAPIERNIEIIEPEINNQKVINTILAITAAISFSLGVYCGRAYPEILDNALKMYNSTSLFIAPKNIK